MATTGFLPGNFTNSASAELIVMSNFLMIMPYAFITAGSISPKPAGTGPTFLIPSSFTINFSCCADRTQPLERIYGMRFGRFHFEK